MAVETSGFFNAEYDEQSDIYDRVYTAEQFAEYFAQFIGNGVFGGILSELKVNQYSPQTATMDVRVTPGKAYINGLWYYLKEDKYFSVPTPSTTSARTDMIVVRLEKDLRKISLVYVSNASTPVREDNIYDLMICRINVPANAVSISDVNISDTRMITEYCGLVTGLVDQIDFDEAYSQFVTWFDDFTSHLSGDVALNLQMEINDLNMEIDETNDTIGTFVQTRTLSASGWSNGVYNLASIYPNNEYDIQVTPCTLTTSAQLKAWSLARPIGSASANTITALGTTPTIDITVMVVATKKGAS